MQITYFGHACLLFEWGDTRLLCDPWTSEHGAFHAAWFQFPDVSRVAPRVPRDPTHLYISHEHQDHLDPTFLAGLSKDTQVLISDHPSPWVGRALKSAGVSRFKRVQSRKKMSVDGAELAIITSDNPHTPDSALWIEQGGVRYFNQNDCEFTGPFQEELRHQFPADVHFLQYAPANWYPMVYDIPPKLKRELYPERRQSRLRKFLGYARGFGARQLVGFAGPAVFLDPAFLEASMPPGGVMPDRSDPQRILRADFVSTPVEVPLPGDRLDKDGHVVESGPFTDWKDDDSSRASYIDAMAKSKAPKIREELDSLRPAEAPFAPGLAAHLEEKSRTAPFLAVALNNVLRIEIVDLGETVTLDTTKRPAVVSQDDGRSPTYHMWAESRFLRPLVEGRWNWDWFLLSMRFKAHREPDRYNSFLQSFLSRSTRLEDRLIEQFEARRSPGVIVVASGGARYEVEKWCPHALANLERASVLPGNILKCGEHGHEFNLDTGAPTNSKDRPLSTKRVRDS